MRESQASPLAKDMGGPMLQPGSVSVHLLTYYLSNFTLTFPSKFCPLALPLASYKMLDPVSFARGILEREHYFKGGKSPEPRLHLITVDSFS